MYTCDCYYQCIHGYMEVKVFYVLKVQDFLNYILPQSYYTHYTCIYKSLVSAVKYYHNTGKQYVCELVVPVIELFIKFFKNVCTTDKLINYYMYKGIHSNSVRTTGTSWSVAAWVVNNDM